MYAEFMATKTGKIRKIWERLERRYSIRVKRFSVVIERLKHRITAIAAKVRRYQGWVDSFRQNRLFETNQRQFYGELKIRKKKDVMMISLCLKNQNSFEETYGVNQQIIRRMQRGYKTCQLKLMLKNWRR